MDIALLIDPCLLLNLLDDVGRLEGLELEFGESLVVVLGGFRDTDLVVEFGVFGDTRRGVRSIAIEGLSWFVRIVPLGESLPPLLLVEL